MEKKPYVVLLHGLGRTKQVFAKMATYLTTQGYLVYNDPYNSLAGAIEDLVDGIAASIRMQCPDENNTIHFVGHSLGAILIRLLIAKHRPKQLGRVVMLAPPNHGSCLVDFLKKYQFYRRNYGLAGQELGTDKTSIIHRLPPVDYEVGIIAGDRSVDWFFSWFILPGKDDGKITVEETKLAGMKDHIVVHATHPFMPSNAKVMKETAYFLQNGRFFRESN